MKQILLVGLGGFLGAVGRFKLSGFVLHHTLEWRFPLATFLINITGCFLIGLLAGMAERHSFFSNDVRLFLFTGIIGGFTTFSAFGYEGIHLFRRGEAGMALFYAALSVVIGFFAVWLGMKLAGIVATQG